MEKEGLSLQEVADRFHIGVATVFRWTKRIESKKTRQRAPSKISDESLLADIENYPDAYIHERSKRLLVSQSGIWYALRRLKMSYKKNLLSS